MTRWENATGTVFYWAQHRAGSCCHSCPSKPCVGTSAQEYTDFFSPRRSWWHSEHQKALLLSLCLQVKENKSIPVTKLLVKYLSGALVKCLQIIGTAAKLFLVTRWLFPHQWTMIKVEEMVFSFSLDEVLTDNKSFYSTSIDFLVFKHGKQNATRFYDAFLKPPTGTGGIKLIKISFSSLSLLEHLFRWS